jgi:hypothetical protein
MGLLESLTPPARRLYDAMVALAERGICKANQRELVAVTGMAFKTFIVLRDDLVRLGLVERFLHKRGRRDWYKILAVTEVERERERIAQEARRASALSSIRDQQQRELRLFDA